MSSQATYELSIRTVTPKTVVEGEPFKVTYHIRNIGKNVFPGGTISVSVSWANLGQNPFVIHHISIGALQPGGSFSHSVIETPLATGYTMFIPILAPNQNFVQIPRGRILLYLEDGRPLTPSMLCGAVRAKSHEEINEFRAVRIALIALFLVVIFQAIDWILRYYYHI